MAQQAKGAYEASWFLPSIWLRPSCLWQFDHTFSILVSHQRLDR